MNKKNEGDITEKLHLCESEKNTRKKKKGGLNCVGLFFHFIWITLDR